MRTLTAAAATEAAKKTGASILRILEVEWGGETGSLYFSDQQLSSPIAAAAKVASWGTIVCEGRADSIGGYATTSVELIDVDYSLKTLFDTFPGPAAKKVYIHQFFEGTEWPDDRVTIFAGFISGDVEFDASTAVWKLSLKGLEKFFDKSLGTPLTRDKFPTIACTDNEGKIIPIVYGSSVKRVPSRLISMPGHAYLDGPVGIHATSLSLTKSCFEMGCTEGGSVSLLIGVVDLWEQFDGYFPSSSSGQFTITGRGSILAEGESPGPYGLEGKNYFLVNKSDLPGYNAGNPTAELPSLAGYPFWFHDGTAWSSAFVIDQWIDNSDSIAVLIEPHGVEFGSGWSWKIGSQPGIIPQWPVSTPVQVIAPWVYAVSHLPSSGIDFVEVRTQMQTSGSGKGNMKYYALNSDRYTVALDNRSYNSLLGRDSSDAGITTVTISDPPVRHGFEDAIFVTLSGPSAYSAPGDIIRHILVNPHLGNVPSALVKINNGVTDVELSFAVTEEIKLHDLVSQLSYQGCCLLFWDQAGVYLNALTYPLDSAISSVNESSLQANSLSLSHSDLEAANTCALAKFRPTCVNPEVKFYRKSTGAVEAYGERRKEIDCWAIQDPTQIVKVIEFWLTYYLSQQRVVKFSCFLDKGLVLQPGDIVSISFQNGSEVRLLDDCSVRVTRTEHVLGNAQRNQAEVIKIEAEFSAWEFEIDDATADLSLCEGDGGDELPQPHDTESSTTLGGLILQAPPWNRLNSNIVTSGGSGGGAEPIFVQVMTENDVTIRQGTVKAKVCTLSFDDSDERNLVTVTATEEIIVVGNPRGSYVKQGARYFAYKIGEKYYLDTQAVFAT